MSQEMAEGSAEGGADRKVRKTRWLKRQALQISTMLPEDPGEARRVLMYALELQGGFLNEEAGGSGGGSNVVPITSAEGRSSPPGKALES